jgi:hypothetical protein
MSRKRALSLVLLTVYCSMLIDGVVACLYKAVVIPWQTDGRTRLTTWELPLSGINGIACDAAGRVYVGTEEYHRVQVYSADGRFLHGVDVGSATAYGTFHFRIVESGQLEVFGVRNRTISDYDQTGFLGWRSTEPPIAWGNVTEIRRSEGRSALSLGNRS